jgi:DnaJ-class molecular chaperone
MTTHAPGVPLATAQVSCGSCRGLGTTAASGQPCSPCHSTGKVLVSQPALHCPRCKGSGKPAEDGYGLPVCAVCRGTGWALRLD